jgi:hypothetical protein
MQPDLAFLIAFPLFAAWLSFICYMLARIGGWAALARKYRATSKPEGKRFDFQSGKIGTVNYGSCLIVYVNDTGLYLKVFPLFRAGHPPLFIPWLEFSDLQEKTIFWLWQVVEMRVGDPPITTVTLPLRLIEERPFAE